MNYVFVPSLQFIASVRVAVVLWSQPDIEEIVSKIDFMDIFDFLTQPVHMKWMKVKKKVEAKVEKVPLPNLLQEKLLDAVSVVALAIFVYERGNVHFSKLSVKELHWTPHGCVDKVKSMQEFVKNDRHSRSMCLPAACRICLVLKFSHWRNRWIWLTNKFRSNHYNLETHYENELFLYWNDYTGMSIFLSLVQYSVEDSYEMGCRYFWQKIQNDVDNKILVDMVLATESLRYRDDEIPIPSQCLSDFFFFLLGKMNDEQKRKVLHTEPVVSLRCFLDWPYQKFFMQTINQLWDYLTAESCISVLENILNKLEEGYRHYDFSALFQKCIQEMPSSYLSYIVRRCALMPDLFRGKEKELVSCLLAHATSEQWEKIFFSPNVASLCKDLARRSEWDTLACFIEKCMNSKSVLGRRGIYKRKVKSFFMRIMYHSKKRHLLRKMYDIVDKL